MKQTISNWYRQCTFSEKAYARKLLAKGWNCAPPRRLTFFKAFVVRYQLGELLKSASDKKSYVNSRPIRYISDNYSETKRNRLSQYPLRFDFAKYGHAVTLRWPFLF